MGFALDWSTVHWLCIVNGWELHPGKDGHMYHRTGRQVMTRAKELLQHES
jgi:hypothetical protein